ncbi:hypothetical protein F1559_005102 [Cyanidiococcus yangmingshanensis]|uniref:Condensin complex subunit 2 n=1 Tax=Cyanidiococcus yangmingshanensis TaxID=2690220 RepID=A0A7J7IR51_9RHOD|nr:hypothetical protein F1559_005102 [Cyanidiococcus yangmingshanensis]
MRSTVGSNVLLAGSAGAGVQAGSLVTKERDSEQPLGSSFTALEDSLCWNDDMQERHEARIARQSKNVSKSVRYGRSPLLRRSREAGASEELELDTTAKKLSDPELLQLYATTIRLCAENRVNAVNSWQLNLIDYIAAMAFSRDSSNDVARKRTNRQSVTDALTQEALGTNFALAGSTIDAGVKIYSYRVDSVHNNAYRVLSGLSQQPSTDAEVVVQEDADCSSNEADSASETPSANRPSGRLKHSKHGWGESTLESNPDQITLRSLEEECTIDPLFMKLSELFDQNGSQELLLRVLDILPDGSLALDSDELADAVGRTLALDDETKSDASVQVPAELFPAALVSWIHTPQAELCPNFTSMLRQLECEAAEAIRAEQAAADRTEPALEMQSLSPVADGRNLHEGDGLSSPRDYGDGFDGMELFSGPWLSTETDRAMTASGKIDACCHSALDGLIRSAHENEHDEDEDEDHGISGLATGIATVEDSSMPQGSSADKDALLSRIAGIGASNVDAFQLYVALQRSGQAAKSLLSAIPRDLFSSWAGPEHWRLPQLSQVLAGQGRTTTPKRPRRKALQPIDFRKPILDPAFEDKFQICRRKAATQLSTAVFERHCSQRTTLPPDHRYTADALFRLFTQPDCLVLGTNSTEALVDFGRSPSDALKTLETDLDWRAFQDEHFCAPLDATAGADASDVDLEVPFASLALTSDIDILGDATTIPLIDAPPAVERIEVAHATRAKRVDMQLLKRQLWDAIESQIGNGAFPGTPSEIPETTLTRLLSNTLPQLTPSLRAELSLSYPWSSNRHFPLWTT